jgi:hypothetical protein
MPPQCPRASPAHHLPSPPHDARVRALRCAHSQLDEGGDGGQRDQNPRQERSSSFAGRVSSSSSSSSSQGAPTSALLRLVSSSREGELKTVS